ncbi:MAG TPA: VIT family protein [Povalibacter sp.]|uniref:VIT1/CCC1 transporter family protein n=1 Tax=Povalibacter sp. TaxID=1962978 RepID=UPI002CECDFB6|nr:VIT family protein [Povalibacter sp.]HMN43381.1 VIT family protein [Povalibacter sp.]
MGHHVHFSNRASWLRAAVLGANDGILSTAGLLVGVASAEASAEQLLVAGIAGLAAGALSMGAGEYVSVSSQADVERADLEIEKRQLATHADYEQRELAAIYVKRGLEPALAMEVSKQLTRHDALAAHARDELGFTPHSRPRPVQAALASAASFTAGALLPLLVSVMAPQGSPEVAIGLASLGSLAILGALAARVGGASPLRGAARVTFWGAFAMLVTSLLGRLVGAAL